MSVWIILGLFFLLLVIFRYRRKIGQTLVSHIETETKSHNTSQYSYAKKRFLLTRAEHEFFDTLVRAVGGEYYIFPQITLGQLVDSRVVGQSWRGAFSHINRKSVDFVLCDKAYISPILVIELDDSSHDFPERQIRDQEVERILASVELPLLRLRNPASFIPAELAQVIRSKIDSTNLL